MDFDSALYLDRLSGEKRLKNCSVVRAAQGRMCLRGTAEQRMICVICCCCSLCFQELLCVGLELWQRWSSDFNLHVYNIHMTPEEMSCFQQTAHVESAICCTWLFGKIRSERQVKINKQNQFSAF